MLLSRGTKNIKGFVDHLNENYYPFVELDIITIVGCVAPYFIDEKTETQFWNPSHMRCIEEGEVFICTKDEYDEKLKEVIAGKYTHCINYFEDVFEQDFDSHREHINLNGECFGFEMKNEFYKYTQCLLTNLKALRWDNPPERFLIFIQSSGKTRFILSIFPSFI